MMRPRLLFPLGFFPTCRKNSGIVWILFKLSRSPLHLLLPAKQDLVILLLWLHVRFCTAHLLISHEQQALEAACTLSNRPNLLVLEQRYPFYLTNVLNEDLGWQIQQNTPVSDRENIGKWSFAWFFISESKVYFIYILSFFNWPQISLFTKGCCQTKKGEKTWSWRCSSRSEVIINFSDSFANPLLPTLSMDAASYFRALKATPPRGPKSSWIIIWPPN